MEGTLDDMIKLLKKVIASGGKQHAPAAFEQALAYAQELQDLNDTTWLRSSAIIVLMMEALRLQGWYVMILNIK